LNNDRLANLALVLVVIGWLLAFYGAMSQLGDPAPNVPRSVIDGHRHMSMTILLTGVTCIISSLWLSGRAFMEARKRSLATAALVVIPIVAIVAGTLY
jgi:hypothetical protein